MSSSSDIPPGLIPTLKFHTASSCTKEWLPYDQTKHYTNAFILQSGKILLGYKKRGFGKDKFNGFGGKVEPGETPLQAAKRELQEEAGIQAPLELVGDMLFIVEGQTTALRVHIFRADEYSGVVTETDEMRPQWFRTDDSNVTGGDDYPPIPFSEMWEDDVYWFPLLLQRKSFACRADFGHDEKLHRWWIGTN